MTSPQENLEKTKSWGLLDLQVAGILGLGVASSRRGGGKDFERADQNWGLRRYFIVDSHGARWNSWLKSIRHYV